MATLVAGLTLNSTDWSTDSLSIVLSQTLSIVGNEQAVGRFTTSAVATKVPVGIFDSIDEKVWIYLKNTSIAVAEKLIFSEDNGGAAGEIFMSLGAEEWAFFPYADNDYLWVEAASGTPVLEYGIFEV